MESHDTTESQSSDLGPYNDVADVARYFRVSAPSIRNDIRAGRIAIVRYGRRVLMTRAAVLAFERTLRGEPE